MKRLVFRPVNREPKFVKPVSSLPTTAQLLVHHFLWHAKKLQLTPEKVATKLGVSVEKLYVLLRHPMQLDLRLICHLEALICRDLLVTPEYRAGYFGRPSPALTACIDRVDQYLVATGKTRILGTARQYPETQRSFHQCVLVR
jgi:hypothetical protein